jgi:hypothetical protein
MNEEKMEQRLVKLENHLSNNDAGAMSDVISAQIDAARAAQTDELRDKLWLAIRSVASVLANPPSFSRRPAALTTSQQAVLDGQIESATEAAIAYFKVVGNLLTQRGGGLYENAQIFALSQTNIMTSHMTKRAQTDNGAGGHIWDGTIKGLKNQTFPASETEETH